MTRTSEGVEKKGDIRLWALFTSVISGYSGRAVLNGCSGMETTPGMVDANIEGYIKGNNCKIVE